jgi:plastocyanin
MRRSTRDRLLLPILLPIGILASIVLMMVLFSRILLNTSPYAATVVALVVSITILVAAGVVASRGHGRGAAGLGSLLGVVAGVAMLAGGIALAVAEPAGEGGGGEATAGFAAEITAPPGAAAEGFDVQALKLPAGEPIELTFHNEDPGVPHNVAIAEKQDPQSPLLFAPEGTITGPGTAVYSIDPLTEGTYHFFCEVHPTTMNGLVEVAPGGAGGPAGGGAGGGVVAIAAQNLQFDKQELDFQADTPSTLEFDNKDAGIPHNVAIYEDDTLAKNLFSFDPFPGPAQRSFDVPGLPQGEYYFHCDVHPTMHGTVVVSGGGEPPGGGGPEPGGGGGGAGGTGAAPPPGEPPASTSAGAAASIAAENLQFSTSTLSLDAGAETPLSFDNRDAGVPHNVSIYAADPASDPGAEQLFTFEPFPGPEERDFTIPALDPGTYVFMCDVHPTMKGDVRVS